MKKTLLLCLFMATVALTGCYRVTPNADQESVLVKKPWLFGHGGVDETPVNTGATFVAASTDHIDFVITPMTITEQFSDMITQDNTPISFNAYLKVQIISGKTPILAQKFGEKWYENNIEAPFRTLVRNAASSHKMFDLTSNRKILDSLEAGLYKSISAYVAKLEIPVTVMQVTIGAVTPPAEVLAETKNTAAQNQSKLTQDARASAELARKQAEINKAIADKAYQQQMNMTTEQYLQLRNLEIEKEKVEMIKDKANVHIIFGDRVKPMVDIK